MRTHATTAIRRRARRVARTRAKVFGTAERPRLAVFRSNRHMYAQLIDDERGRTLASGSTQSALPDSEKSARRKTDAARALGKSLAERARGLGIRHAVFDRRAYRYHGRVRSVAEGARAGGLTI